jgi:soluble lytic murein transglycosylase-like protein
VKLKRLTAATLGALALVPAAARAEIAVLTNGMTMKVSSYRFDEQTVTLFLKGGGDVTVPSSLIQGIVPDEIMEEVAAAVAETQAGDPNDVRALARAAARRHGVDPALVLAVISVESNFRTDAVSHKGAQGLMQLMPGTARELGVKDPLDPAANLDGGTRYLNALLRQYDGDLKRALAAYNAGAGAVNRHGGVPPYRETRQYVQKVLERYKAPAR